MQYLNLQLKGLYTSPNPLSEVPPGALLKAKNVVADKYGIIETRRGFNKYGNQLGGTINSMFNYQDKLIVNYGTKLAYDSGSGNWSDYSGTFNPPSGAVSIRGLEASKNFYFTTSSGVGKLDVISGTPSQAGGIKAIDATATLTAAGAGFFTKNNQLAYRIVWGFRDANNNLILGSPSQIVSITNPNAGANDTVTLKITIPQGITTSHFYQIYRSVLSGGESIVANDELGLVYENYPTAGQIAASSITVVDVIPESLRGATIYTAPSQQGILQSNDPPPLAQDIAFYKNTVFYANCKSKQRIFLTLVSVAGTGLIVNDTITIGATTYTAKGAENPASAQFLCYTAGTPAENISKSAQSLVRVINQYASNTQYYAYYMSGYNDLPGKMLIEERSIGGASFALTSSNGGAYNPVLPVSGTTISTSNDVAQNRIYVSKTLQPEAVPTANYIDVGSADQPIYRVMPLRDSVFIFKSDGLFRITGENINNFQVSLFDITTNLLCPESAVAFDNKIYAYTTQGIVSISDTGAQVLSFVIESDILPIQTYSDFSSVSFGVTYNSDRKYIFFTKSVNKDTYPTQAYVYNNLVQQFTRWEFNATCGIVNSADDRLYLGASDNNYVYRERKDFALSDYADDEMAVAVTGHADLTVALASTTGINIGDVLYQSGSKSSVVTIDSPTQVTVTDSNINWKVGAATVYNPIDVEIETIQQTAQNPSVLKHFRDVIVFFRKANFNSLNIGIKSNLSPSTDNTPIIPSNPALWGGAQWGSFGWGGGEADYQVIRTLVPRNKQRGHWIIININHSNARDYFAMAGMAMNFDVMSERIH